NPEYVKARPLNPRPLNPARMRQAEEHRQQEQRRQAAKPGDVTQDARELVRSADALTGCRPGMPHREIVERQDISREELEARYEALHPQTEEEAVDGPADEALRVLDPRRGREDIRRPQARGLQVARDPRPARDQAGRPTLSR